MGVEIISRNIKATNFLYVSQCADGMLAQHKNINIF